MQSLSSAGQRELGETLTKGGLGIAKSIFISVYETALTAVLSFPFDTGLTGCFYCPNALLTANFAICGHLMATQDLARGVGMLGKHFLEALPLLAAAGLAAAALGAAILVGAPAKHIWVSCMAYMPASCQWQRDHQNPAWACTVAAMHNGARCASKHATQMLG